MEKIKELIAILADEKRILSIVKEEANAIKAKFGDERRTVIENISGEVDVEDLIPVEECAITLTHYGYIKRQLTTNYHSQRRGGRGISGLTRREEDFVEELFVCSTHDYVLFFTSLGRVYRLKGYELPEGSRTSKGMNVANLLPISQDEKITAMIKVSEFEEGKYLVMVTKKGIIKRTALTDYNTSRKGGVIGIVLDEGDELVRVRLTDGQADLLVGTSRGKAIRFCEQDARPLSRAAHGVKAITLGEKDEVIGMSVVREGAMLLSITENGYGKRVTLDSYHNQYRGGKGLTSYTINDKTGFVSGMKVVDDDDDAIVISSDGVIIRVHVSEISVYSRYAQGVKVMRVNEGAHVVTFARSPHEEESEDEQENEQIDENADEISDEIDEYTDIVSDTSVEIEDKTDTDLK